MNVRSLREALETIGMRGCSLRATQDEYEKAVGRSHILPAVFLFQ